MSKKENDIICLKVFNSRVDAAAALDILDEASITAGIDGDLWPSVLGVPVPGAGAYRLMVFRRDAERATQLLAQFFSTLDAD